MTAQETLTDKPLVHIIDDDEAVLDSLSLLLDSVNIAHKTYISALAFFAQYTESQLAILSGCIVLDIRMPSMSGMECQQKLNAVKCNMPVIFLTGHGDVPMAVEAMKKGAVEFIQKPFREQLLLDCIQDALASNQLSQTQLHQSTSIQKRLASLSARETQVLEKIIDGQANKVIASTLCLSQRTIEIHRAHVMEKMQAHSLAELVKMVMSVK